MAASMPWMPYPFGPQSQPQSQSQAQAQAQSQQYAQLANPLSPLPPSTPPPDTAFLSPGMAQPPLSPQLLKSFAHEVYNAGAQLGALGFNTHALHANLLAMGMPPVSGPLAKPAALPTTGSRAMQGTVAAGVAERQRRKEAALKAQQEQVAHDADAQNADVHDADAHDASAHDVQTHSAPSTASTATSAQTKNSTHTEGTEPTETEGAMHTKPQTLSPPPAPPTPAPRTRPDTLQRPGQTSSAPAPSAATASAAAHAADPRYVAMASRIAAYYHQRCQAVARFQQQRCHAWAAVQRQKAAELNQAAMLVVAWYVRDRIQRRRHRQTRRFRRGLAARTAMQPAATCGGRVGKGEAVRSWVLGVEATPEADLARAPTPPAMDLDTDDHGADDARDADARLFSVADNLIKSQLARIDVPMLGALAFDPSDSESDDDDDGRPRDDPPDARDNGRGKTSPRPVEDARLRLHPAALVAEDYIDDDDDLDASTSSYSCDDEHAEQSSEVVHHGTGHNSHETSSY